VGIRRDNHGDTEDTEKKIYGKRRRLTTEAQSHRGHRENIKRKIKNSALGQCFFGAKT